MSNPDQDKRYRNKVLKDNTPERPRGKRTSHDVTPQTTEEDKQLDPQTAEQLAGSAKAREVLDHQDDDQSDSNTASKR